LLCRCFHSALSDRSLFQRRLALNVNGAYTVPEKPGDDTVTIIDLGVSPPKLLGEVKAPSGVVGPPQNVAITTDESIALVAAAMKLDPADPKKLTPATGFR
jgi:hypothetical protein